jgi:DNA-binding NarL/FixJ family response regulator
VSSDQVNVFLLCVNRLLREALIRILDKNAHVSVIGVCGYSPQALKEVIACQPRVILLDSFGVAPAQHAILRFIRENLPKTSTVMMGMEAKEEDFLFAVREGAAGFVLSEAPSTEVIEAIRRVAAGESVYPPCFSATLFRYASQHLVNRQNLQTRSRSELSRREQQLIELICWGQSNKEIAGSLNLSEHTVKNHVHRIMRKTGTHDRASLVERYQGETSRIV